MNWKLSGWKTYAIAIAMVIASGLAAQGYITQEQLAIIIAILTGGGLAALRAGVAKNGSK
jgi:hypothetical protein